MKRILNCIIVFVMVGQVNIVEGQTVAKKCMEKVRTYSRKINNISFPEGKLVYYISYQTKTVMRDSINYPTTDVNIKVLLSNNQLHTLTDDIEVYQDNRDAFMIIHSKKVVIWATSTIRADKNQKIKELSTLRDTLFDLCDATSCISLKNKQGTNLNKLTLKANKHAQNAFKISGLHFLYQPENGKIAEVTVNYLPSYQVQRTTTTYKEVNFNYSAKMNKQVITKILDKNNQLLSQYRGYQLIDNR